MVFPLLVLRAFRDALIDFRTVSHNNGAVKE